MDGGTTVCGRRRVPNPERTLYLSRMRNTFANTHRNSNGYTEPNGNKYCDPECNTQREPHRNSYGNTCFNPATTSHTTRTADSKTSAPQWPLRNYASQRRAIP